MMRNILLCLLFIGMISCAESDNLNKELTGNEFSYSLFSGSDFGYEGLVTISEKRSGTAQVLIELSGPTGESFFPAHLHFNSFDTPDAELAALLSPINARTGISLTDLDFLADESLISFDDLVEFNGHIKIHFDDGANQDIILAFGNIGSNKLMLDGQAAQCDGPN